MSNRITWSNDGEEPCLDIDVTLEDSGGVLIAFSIRHYIVFYGITSEAVFGLGPLTTNLEY